MLRPELANLPQIRAQFLDLSRRSIKLVHHNLVLTREVRAFPDRHIYYVVRDYVDGVTLQKLLESGRVFSPDQIMKILRQVLRSLTPLHASGMVHGSIKPSNIFLCGEDRVILGDLALPLRGISVQLDRLSYDYRYAPPEMFRQDGTLGPWSDFYALGCVAYELACGAPPFVSDNHFELAGKHDREASRACPAGAAAAWGRLAMPCFFVSWPSRLRTDSRTWMWPFRPSTSCAPHCGPGPSSMTHRLRFWGMHR